MIIGICGIIGSGKNTLAEILVNEFGFRQDSFASPLKDAVSSIFGWDRNMLEGITDESRAWRESVDEWWAQRLDIPHLTPRWILQNWGTDILRSQFHDDIWIASCENRLRQTTDDVVISDLRFPNEFRAMESIGAITIRVARGESPDWFLAAQKLAHLPNLSPEAREAQKILVDSGVHESEWAWAGQSTTYFIRNDGSIDELRKYAKQIVIEAKA